LVERMDLLVWLEHPRLTVQRRVVRRTLTRWQRHEELWNGNREQPFWRILTDHDHIVRWSWRVYGKYPAEIPSLLTAPGGERLTVVRLAGQRQVETWLAGPFAAAARESQREVPSFPPED